MRSRLLALLALAIAPATAAAVTDPGRAARTDSNFDARSATVVAPKHLAAVAALRSRLGAGALVSVDAQTGALRQVGRVDGTLTGPSSADPAAIAIGYVRANRAAFGLTNADISNLVLVRRVNSGDGLVRLFWQQRADGVPALGSGLRANFTADGRLINLAGSPVSGVSAVRVAPRLSARQARVAAYAGVGASARPSVARTSRTARRSTTFSGGDSASLGVLAGATKRVVWDTSIRVDAAHWYRTLVDARTGKTLYRRNLVQNVTGNVHLNYPGATTGGGQANVAFGAGWVGATPGANKLNGPNSVAWTDLNDNDLLDSGEEIPASDGAGNFTYPPLYTTNGTPFAACVAALPCSWDPTTSIAPANRKQNRLQAATQAFFFVNTFHDWLQKAPISFTTANGGFQTTDPVLTQALDGADRADPGTGQTPDNNHIDNANMGTPPDGQSPTMQMYLFHTPTAPLAPFPAGDPFLPSNGGDEADVLYHEYTHGLSNRLVVDATGNSTLFSAQAGSMGEAWSDWYAMDFLNEPTGNPCGSGVACFTDGPNADELVGAYVSAGKVGPNAIRFQAIDCPAGPPTGANAANCAAPGGVVPAGGFTYADFGKIAGSPEVHADGEIWGQTLWDLRTAVGPPLARRLVTRAMELSPDDPSYLDMRNSILQANVAFNANNAGTRNTIWTVFAHRGMGYFAGSIDSNDASPVADFSVPPAANAPKGTVSGTVIDVNSHAPVVGARVGLPGLDSGFTGDPGSTTTATGSYAMPAAFAHAYPYLASVGGGYEPALVKPFTLAAGAQVRNLQNKRGWALISGGGTVQSFTGPDFSDFGCGPFGAIDGGLGSGWGSIPGGTITLKLPAKVNVTDFGVDPGATCGDAATANTKGFSIATSTDGVSFTTAVGGTFAQNQGGHINTLLPTLGKANVQYVRFTIVSNYADPNGFADVSEIQVHGTQVGPMTVRIGGSTVVQYKKTTTFTSEGSKGPDGSPVVAQTWSRPGGPTTHAATYQVKSSKLGARIKITLAVRDFVGRTGTLTRTFVVKDTLGPDVTIKTKGSKVNRSVTISGKVSDPSGIKKTVTVRFGDGKSKTVKVKRGRYSVKHSYKSKKAFTIAVSAKDKRGHSSRTTKVLTIK